jgi:hypothetical protein
VITIGIQTLQIFDRSDGIVVVGLESGIGGCHSGVAGRFMAMKMTFTVGVECCYAFVVDWYSEESNVVTAMKHDTAMCSPLYNYGYSGSSDETTDVDAMIFMIRLQCRPPFSFPRVMGAEGATYTDASCCVEESDGKKP